jgi:hypothetical protein
MNTLCSSLLFFAPEQDIVLRAGIAPQEYFYFDKSKYVKARAGHPVSFE